MNVWEILGIAPTIDKKTIRKAYAQKSREIHPEERPEEFKRLHEAYQAALGYAAFVARGNLPPESAAAGADEMTEVKGDTAADAGEMTAAENESENEAKTPVMESDTSEDEAKTSTAESETPVIENGVSEKEAGTEELLSYFADSKEKQRQCFDAFLKYWTEMESPYKNPQAQAWWKEYLASPDFQAICRHPAVMRILAEELDEKFFLGLNDMKLLFWEAYGFREEDREALQGEEKKLWKCLYPAYEMQQRVRENAKAAAKTEMAIRIFAGAAAVLIAAVCLFTFFAYRRRQEEGKKYLARYMAGQYADTSFSEPERRETQSDGSFTYVLHSAAHPELEITARVKDTYEDGERGYLVIEDYKKLLLEYYAPQYGLEAGRVDFYEGLYAGREEVEYSCLLYEDCGQIDDFCEKATKMFREQKELQGLAETAVCTEKIVYPALQLQGGVAHFPFAEPQIYDLRTADAAELAASLKEAHMIYMFQYEPWNITPEQYREWGAAYEKICERWENENGEWHELYDPETGEFLCRLFLFTYDYIDGYYSNVSIPRYTRGLTVGNAYYFLLERGAKLSVDEDGGGFRVNFYGNTKSFGWEPEVEFNELQKWY